MMTTTQLPNLASRLLDAGIPVVVCRPNPSWRPGSTAPDVLPPSGWATVTATEARVAVERDYRPGVDTLAMVGGHGIDIFDLDTKNQGVTHDDIPAEIRAYGITLSPSGGAHYPIPSTGYGKGALSIGGKHVGDYIGGTVDGGSRMLAFLPGSARPKYRGSDYQEVLEWDIDRILDSEPPEIAVAILEQSGNLTRSGRAGKATATTHEAQAFFADHSEIVECDYGNTELRRLIDQAPRTKRHDWFIAAAARVTELIKAGCLDAGAADVLADKLHDIKPEGGTNPFTCFAWAIGNTIATSDCPQHGPVEVWLREAGSNAELSREDAVFGLSSELSWLRDLARARMVSPWALLAACTARVIACVGPAWLIPPFVGTEASLNFYVALLGPSNSGKTITSSVAEYALPTARVDIVNPSSGEGLISIFTTQEKGVDIEIRQNALSVIDEIKTLGGQQDRSGSTLGSVLRSAWSGAEISTHAADASRRRRLRKGTYRYCMVAGVQYDTADVLMADDGAGTPQRFLWIPASDPFAVLDHPEPEPGPLAQWGPPRFAQGVKDWYITYPPGVREHVRESRLAAVRNDDADRDSLYGHMLLVRLKFAAGLALLHGTTTVSAELWEASGHVIELSNRTLRSVLAHSSKQFEKKAAAKGYAESLAAEARTEREVVKLARDIGARVAREPDGLTASKLRKSVATRRREMVPEGVAKAIELGYIEEVLKPHRQRPEVSVSHYVKGSVAP